MKTRFQVGDKVSMRAFTDSDGKFHEQIDGLRVESIQFVDFEYAPHWRLKAIYPDKPFCYHEGNQRFFIATREEVQSLTQNESKQSATT